MKNVLYSLLLGAAVFMVKPAEAQVSVNVNIGRQPVWGPSGYERASYYYMPEIDVYYNVASNLYTYMSGRRWVTRKNLPRKYRNFDFYRTYKVVLNDRNPWNYHARHRQHYAGYANNYRQVNIRDYRNSHHRGPVNHDRRYVYSDRGPSMEHNRRTMDHNRRQGDGRQQSGRFNNGRNDRNDRNDRNARNDRNDRNDRNNGPQRNEGHNRSNEHRGR